MFKFEELPEEITLKVFSFLPQSCLQNYVANVCQKWNRICKDNSLYHRITFDSTVSLRTVLKIISKYSTIIQRVMISERNDIDEILRIVSLCENLRQLVLKSCRSSSYACSARICSELNAHLISAILEHNHFLEVLEITSTAVQNGCIRLSGCNLKKLVIKSGYYNRMIEETTNCMLQNQLHILNLQGLIISRETLFNIISANEKTLLEVMLDVWQPQLGSYDQIIEAVSECSNLTRLMLRNVAFYCICDDSFSRLTKLRKLSTIVFSKIEKVTTRGYVALFEQPHSGCVNEIFLNACDGVNGSVLKTIAEHCPNLRKFGIHQSRTAEVNLIRPADVLHLAAKCTRLRFLNLCYTHRSVGQALPDIVAASPSLAEFQFCEYLSDDPKIFLVTLHVVVSRQVKNFRVSIERNINADEYVVGIRDDSRE